MFILLIIVGFIGVIIWASHQNANREMNAAIALAHLQEEERKKEEILEEQRYQKMEEEEKEEKELERKLTEEVRQLLSKLPYTPPRDFLKQLVVAENNYNLDNEEDRYNAEVDTETILMRMRGASLYWQTFIWQAWIDQADEYGIPLPESVDRIAAGALYRIYNSDDCYNIPRNGTEHDLASANREAKRAIDRRREAAGEWPFTSEHTAELLENEKRSLKALFEDEGLKERCGSHLEEMRVQTRRRIKELEKELEEYIKKGQ